VGRRTARSRHVMVNAALMPAVTPEPLALSV